MRNVRSEFEAQLVKDMEKFDQQWERTSRASLIIVYAVIAFYLALAIGALIGCYFVLQAVL